MEALEWLELRQMKLLKKICPYRQSERKDLYQQYAVELINSGNAYYALIQRKLWMQEN
jgi:glutamyl-tRNA synthetase